MFDFHIETGSVTTPKGFLAGAVASGLKAQGLDLALVYSMIPAQAAAVFTVNKVQAAPVILSRNHVANGQARAVIINAGCANACTGDQGMVDAQETAAITAKVLGVAPQEILVASTGVIGRPLQMDKLRRAIPEVNRQLSPQGGEEAARAIMTTDTMPKHFSVTFELAGAEVHIGAMAKGSGMINPNMATMLCAITTDVAITAACLDSALRTAVDQTLNRLTVDGEMSTNDTVFVLANGAAGNIKIESEGASLQQFTDALTQICLALTRAIAADGEGASKLFIVEVTGARDEDQAHQAAKAIANSALVKTAIFGRDPNWGRVVQAAGACGVEMDASRMSVDFAGMAVVRNGQPVPFDAEAMRTALSAKEVQAQMDLAVGTANTRVYSCDLTYDYIKINADYTT